jgi:hypothetical protein
MTAIPINPILFKYKGNRCANCGLTVEEMLQQYGVINKIFHFHHVDPTKKHPDYDNLIQRTLSAEQLDEVDKCIFLCDRCHTVLHGQKKTATLTLTRNLGDRVVEQELKCNVIVDMKDNTLHFFSDQPYLLDLYDVQRGEERPQPMTGLDLENNDTLSRFLLETRETEILRILRHEDRKVMLEAKKLDSRKCHVEPSVEFPLLKFNGLHDDGTLHVSVRNRQIVFKPKDGPSQVNPPLGVFQYWYILSYADIRKVLKKKKGN